MERIRYICLNCGATNYKDITFNSELESKSITKINMTEAIETAQKKLDLLNADLATYRLQHGMRGKLVKIYRQMGHVSQSLYSVSCQVKELEKRLEELGQ